MFVASALLATIDSLTQRHQLSRLLYTALLTKWYFGNLNHLGFYRFGGRVANGGMWSNVKVIDGVVLCTGSVNVGDRIRRIHE